MKHYSGIDYEHFLDDIRDMYPFSVEEAVLVELIANSLDAKTTLLDFRIDTQQQTFELLDNGNGMDAKGFEMYHNFSTSFKRKGQGIGFAGLGAKLALKIADRIVTETRQKETGRGKTFWGASEWKFERKRKTAHPVWYDNDERTLAHHGTRARMYLKRSKSPLLDPAEIRRVVLSHYLPILLLPEFYDSLKLYRRVAVLVNGELLQPPALSEPTNIKSKQTVLYRGHSRKPFALARFELHPRPLPDSLQGVAISTFGKIIRREYFKQFFPGMECVTGVIEVPELVESLTTSKCDFRREGTAGRKYYRFTKSAQVEFRRWLENNRLIRQHDEKPDRDVQRLQRVINTIVGEIPDLQQFYGFRSLHEALAKEPEGEYRGAKPEPRSVSEQGAATATEEERLLQEALEQAAREGRTLEPGDDFNTTKRLRNIKFGPTIRHVASPDRPDISWIEGDVVFINTGHPTYIKALDKKVVEYHHLFAVALAMLRDVPTAHEKLELLERFMSEWGRL